MKKILIVVTSHDQLGTTGKKTGYYLPEVTHPFFKLTDAGFTIDFVSPKGGKAPMDEKSRDLNDPENKKFLENPVYMNKIEHTFRPDEIDFQKYSAIVYAGGHGTMWDFPDNHDLAHLAAQIYEHGGVVAAVCHGPAALINIKLANGKYLIDGKKVSSFTNAEEKEVGLTEVVPFLLESKLVARGAKFQPAANWSNKVVVDERLVTGQNPQSAASLGEAVVKLLEKS